MIVHSSAGVGNFIFVNTSSLKNAVLWMLRRVALVRADVSEKISASLIRVTTFGELGTTLAITSNRCTLLRNTSVASYG
jgi:hypothetical protein